MGICPDGELYWCGIVLMASCPDAVGSCPEGELYW